MTCNCLMINTARDWRSRIVKIRSEFLIAVLSRMMVLALRVLFMTCRIKKYLAVPEGVPDNQTGERCHTYSIWHDSLLVCIFITRRPKMIALVGAHRDGSYVSQVLKAVGIRPIRGSSSKGGAKAIVEILERAEGHDVAMTPDGPRGPRREMKSGCAFISGHTGQPVLATSFTCTNAWHIKGSWTTLMVPKPFSTIYCLSGNPIAVPRNASRGQIELLTQQIQAEMDRVNALGERLASGEKFDVQGQLSQQILRAVA